MYKKEIIFYKVMKQSSSFMSRLLYNSLKINIKTKQAQNMCIAAQFKFLGQTGSNKVGSLGSKHKFTLLLVPDYQPKAKFMLRFV